MAERPANGREYPLRDFYYFELGKASAEPTGAGIALFGFHFEHGHLVAPEVLKNFKGDFGTFDRRGTDFNVGTVFLGEKERGGGDFGADFGVLSVGFDNVAYFHGVLFSSDFYDREHLELMVNSGKEYTDFGFEINRILPKKSFRKREIRVTFENWSETYL
jgi:hypothetical protein